MSADFRKDLYDQLGKDYQGTYEQFTEDLGNEEFQRILYDATDDKGSFADFQSRLNAKDEPKQTAPESTNEFRPVDIEEDKPLISDANPDISAIPSEPTASVAPTAPSAPQVNDAPKVQGTTASKKVVSKPKVQPQGKPKQTAKANAQVQQKVVQKPQQQAQSVQPQAAPQDTVQASQAALNSQFSEDKAQQSTSEQNEPYMQDGFKLQDNPNRPKKSYAPGAPYSQVPEGYHNVSYAGSNSITVGDDINGGTAVIIGWGGGENVSQLNKEGIRRMYSGGQGNPAVYKKVTDECKDVSSVDLITTFNELANKPQLSAEDRTYMAAITNVLHTRDLGLADGTELTRAEDEALTIRKFYPKVASTRPIAYIANVLSGETRNLIETAQKEILSDRQFELDPEDAQIANINKGLKYIGAENLTKRLNEMFSRHSAEIISTALFRAERNGTDINTETDKIVKNINNSVIEPIMRKYKVGSGLEYVIRSAIEDSLWGKIAKAWANYATGTNPGDMTPMSESAKNLEDYNATFAQKSAATVLGMGLNWAPGIGIAGRTYGTIAKAVAPYTSRMAVNFGAAKLSENGLKFTLKEIGKDAARALAVNGSMGAVKSVGGVIARSLGNQMLSAKVLTSIANGAIAGTGYGMVESAISQLAKGNYNVTENVKEALNTGMQFGMFGALNPIVGNYAARANTKLGKLGVYAAGTMAETAMFATGQIANDYKNGKLTLESASDALMSAFVQVVALKAPGWADAARQRYKEHKTGRKAWGFEFDRDDFKALGVKDTDDLINHIVSGENMFRDGDMETVPTRDQYGRPIPRETRVAFAASEFNNFRAIMNSDVPASTKAKVVYLMTGQMLAEPAIYGAETEHTEDGKVRIWSVDSNGNRIAKMDYNSRDTKGINARQTYIEDNTDANIRGNKMNLCAAASIQEAQLAAVNEYAKEHNISTEELAKAIEQDEKLAEQVYSTAQEPTLLKLFKQIAPEAEVDKAIKTPKSERTERQQQIVDAVDDILRKEAERYGFTEAEKPNEVVDVDASEYTEPKVIESPAEEKPQRPNREAPEFDTVHEEPAEEVVASWREDVKVLDTEELEKSREQLAEQEQTPKIKALIGVMDAELEARRNLQPQSADEGEANEGEGGEGYDDADIAKMSDEELVQTLSAVEGSEDPAVLELKGKLEAEQKRRAEVEQGEGEQPVEQKPSVPVEEPKAEDPTAPTEEQPAEVSGEESAPKEDEPAPEEVAETPAAPVEQTPEAENEPTGAAADAEGEAPAQEMEQNEDVPQSPQPKVEEKTEGGKIANETVDGVPDVSHDTPTDARRRGYRRSNGYRYDRQAELHPIKGKGTNVKFADGVTENGHYAVIDAENLQPSHIEGSRNVMHFLDEAQPKERNDATSRAAATKIASHINPAEVASAVTAYTGAPTVNARGEVIQGNNRSAALRQMWEEYPDQAETYARYLVEHAADFGLKPQTIASMKHPVLVNMLDVNVVRAIELGQYVAQDTESGGTERIKPRNTVQKLGCKGLGQFAKKLLDSTDDDATFAQLLDRNGVDVLKWLHLKGYITDTQYASAFNSRGALTDEAKNDLRGIMLQSIFRDGNTHLEEMFNELPAKAQRAILATAYRDFDNPQSERMVPQLQSSIEAFHELMSDRAFVAAKNFEEASRAVELWKRQYQFDDSNGKPVLPSDKYSNFAMVLAAMYKGQTQKHMQSAFGKIYDLVQGTQKADLFGAPDNTPRTLEQAVKETLNIEFYGKNGSVPLAGNDSDGQRGRRGSKEYARAGRQGKGGNEPSERERGTDGVRKQEITDGHGEEGNAQTIERNHSQGRKSDSLSGGVSEERNAERVAARSDRSDLRVFETGLAASRREHNGDGARARRKAESERLVKVAKENNLFVPNTEVQAYNGKINKRTGESVVFVDSQNGKVIKVKDPYAKSAMKSGVQPEDAVFEHLVHNRLFPETSYTFEGISEKDGSVRIVLSQNYVKSSRQATEKQIIDELAKRGLYPEGKYSFGNDLVTVTDVEGDNVLVGKDGKLYFIDPIINFKKPINEIFDALDDGQSRGKGRKVKRQQAEDGEPLLAEEEVALRDAFVDTLKDSGLDITTDDAEAQRMLDAANGRVKEMGSHTNKHMAEIGAHYEGKALAKNEQAIVDVFSGNKDRQTVTFTRNDGKERRMVFVQGHELKAGTKHAVYRHYGEKVGWFDADEVTKTYDVLTLGDRSEKKGKIEYTYTDKKNGVEYTVAAEKSGGKEKFVSFYTNRKAPESNSQNTQLSAQVDNDALETAKVDKNTETAKDVVTIQQRKSNNENGVHFFRTSDGEVYGLTDGKRIYIDSRIATAETPIHEYAHLWSAAVRANNPEEWGNIVELMKGQRELWEKVKKDYPDLKTDDEIAEEVLSHYSGKRGAERLRQEMRDIAEGEGSATMKEKALKALEAVRDALNRFWKQVADFLHIHYESAEQVADQVMRDALNGVDPRRYTPESTEGVIKLSMVRNPFGGNSGYVGYSMSKRAAKAREDGRFPKTDFRKEYGVSPKSFDALVDAGIIDNSEWHHTSVYGNKTTFYGWKGLGGYIYAANKKEIDKMVKGHKPMTWDEFTDLLLNHNPYKRQSTSEQFSNRMNEVDRWQRREERNLNFDYEFKNSDEEQAERWDKLQGIWAEAKKRKDAVRAEFPEDAHVEAMNEMHAQWESEQHIKFKDQKGAFSQELRDYFEDKKKDLFDDELRKAGIMKGEKQWSRPEFADIYNDNKAEIESMIEDLKLDDIENPYSLEEADIPGPAYRQDYDEVRKKESAEKNAVDRKARRKDFKEAHPISYERDEIIRNEKKAIEEKYAPLYDEVLRKHPEEQKRREEEIERQRKYGEWEDSPELQQQTRDALTRDALIDYFEQKYYDSHKTDVSNDTGMKERVDAIRDLRPITIEVGSTKKENVKKAYDSLGTATNISDGKTVSFYHGVFGKMWRGENSMFAKVAPHLKTLFEKSLYGFSRKDNMAGKVRPDGTIHKEHRNIDDYDYYIAKANVEGKSYYVRFTVQNEIKGSSGVHDVMCTNVEIYENPIRDASASTIRGERLVSNEVSDTKLIDLFKTSNRFVEKEIDKGMKFRFLDDNDPMAKGHDAMVARVQELSEKLHTPVRLITTGEEVAKLPTVRQRRMKGGYNTTTGEVTIVVPNNANVADIENTFVHEVVGHSGLRVLFPDEAKFNNALDELYRVSNGRIREIIDRDTQNMVDDYAARQVRKGVDADKARKEAEKKRDEYRRIATEEYGSRLAGRIGEEGFEKLSAEEKTFWGRLKAQLQKALQRLLAGLKIPFNLRKWSDKDWAYILHESYKRKRNGGNPSLTDIADTVSMREKTKFGEGTDEHSRFLLIGEQGAENVDKVEKSTERIDSRKVANEMEAAGKDAKAIKMATGWERGADGKWRYEVPDVELKDPTEWVDKRGAKLKDVVTGENAEQIFAAYPELANVKIKKGSGAAGGGYDHDANTIELNVGDFRKYSAYKAKYDDPAIQDVLDKVGKSIRETLVHEMQHYVQAQEGFARGGSPNTVGEDGNRLGKEGYKNLAGEVEARNAANRIGMTDKERRNTPASATEDVPRDKQIIYYGNASSREEMLSMQRGIDEERRKLAKENEDRKSLVTSGSYFSGGGLLEEGLKGIISPKLAVEFNEKIAGVYADNHGNHIVTADVREVDPRELIEHIDGEVQYFHASPVCKNFSKAKADAEEVTLDKETAQATADFISQVKPKVVTIENVKGYRNSESLGIITKALEDAGYKYDVDVYNAADFGGYTKRERLIVRAVRDGKLPDKPQPLAEDLRPTGWLESVSDLIDTLPEKKSGVPAWMDERLKGEGIDYRNIDKPLYVFGQGNSRTTISHAFADELLPTLRTHGGDVIIMPDGRVLKATPRVLARITGLSDDYQMPATDDLAHTIVGNGIPTQLTQGVIAPLLDKAFNDDLAEDDGMMFRDPVSEEEYNNLRSEQIEKSREGVVESFDQDIAQAQDVLDKGEKPHEFTDEEKKKLADAEKELNVVLHTPINLHTIAKRTAREKELREEIKSLKALKDGKEPLTDEEISKLEDHIWQLEQQRDDLMNEQTRHHYRDVAEYDLDTIYNVKGRISASEEMRKGLLNGRSVDTLSEAEQRMVHRLDRDIKADKARLQQLEYQRPIRPHFEKIDPPEPPEARAGEEPVPDEYETVDSLSYQARLRDYINQLQDESLDDKEYKKALSQFHEELAKRREALDEYEDEMADWTSTQRRLQKYVAEQEAMNAAEDMRAIYEGNYDGTDHEAVKLADFGACINTAFSTETDAAIYVRNMIIERRRAIQKGYAEDARIAQEVNDFVKGQFKDESEQRMVLHDLVDYVEGTAEVPESLKPIVKKIRDYLNDVIAAEQSAGNAGALKYRKDYVPHIWDMARSNPDEVAQAKLAEGGQGAASTKLRFLNERVFDTYAEGLEHGLVPKYDNICDILLDYGHSQAEAAANKKVVDLLKFMQVHDGENFVPVLREIRTKEHYRTDSEGGRNKYFPIDNTAFQGLEVLCLSPSKANPKGKIYSALNLIFGNTELSDNPTVNSVIYGWNTLASVLKRVKFTFSAFHAVALTEHFASQVPGAKGGPLAQIPRTFYEVSKMIVNTIATGKTEVEMNPDDMTEAASHFVKFGATQDYAAKDVKNTFTKLDEMLADFGNDEKRSAFAHAMVDIIRKGASKTTWPFRKFMDGMDWVLWNFLHDGYKMKTWQWRSAEVKAQAKRENWSEHELRRALDELGQSINDMYGGQHYDLIGVSPKTKKILDALLLSPDWNLSWLRLNSGIGGVGKLYKGIGQKSVSTHTREKMCARAVLLTAAAVYAFWNAINWWRREKDKKENPDIYKRAEVDEFGLGDILLSPWNTLNSPGKGTYVFWGRDKNTGREIYVREGKQVREFPDLFFDESGQLDPIAATLHVATNKINPLFQLIGGVYPDVFTSKYQSDLDKNIEGSHGLVRQAYRAQALAANLAPFSFQNWASGNKPISAMDFFLPTSNGLSYYRAKEAAQEAIANGDDATLAQLVTRMRLNGLNAADIIQTAKNAVGKEAAKYGMESITNATTALEAFDNAQTPAQKRYAERRYQGYVDALSDVTRRDALVQEAMDVATGQAKSDDAYQMLRKGSDLKDDAKLSTIKTHVKESVAAKSYEDAQKTSNAIYKRLHDAYKAKFGKADREAYPNEIRKHSDKSVDGMTGLELNQKWAHSQDMRDYVTKELGLSKSFCDELAKALDTEARYKDDRTVTMKKEIDNYNKEVATLKKQIEKEPSNATMWMNQIRQKRTALLKKLKKH